MARDLINICFHGIGSPHRELEPDEDRYWIAADEFHRILDELAGRPDVRLSFDDGNASDLEIGLPALRERGLTATFFVIAGRLDTPGSLGSADVQALRDAGMVIGTHGMWHRPWRGLTAADRTTELVDARERLAAVVGRPVEQAALPLGRYDRRVLSDLHRLGYARVYTSDRRKAQAASWLQPRFSVVASDSAASFRAAVLPDPPLPRRLRLAAVGLVKRLR